MTIQDETTRLEWAATWSARLSAMFDKPAKKTTSQRLWRMRFFQDGDYLVCTLVQTLVPPPGVSSDQAIWVSAWLTRPYHKASMAGGSVVQFALAGQYSMDEIVAWLRLDTLDPESGAEWRDETKYSDIVTVGSLLTKHLN
jgi:hypothetical protein